ncbi:MAG: ferritin-like domain-containing protein [Chthoniobacterales bacterium]
MNSLDWLNYYQLNKTNRPEPKWGLPSPLDESVQRIIAHSLSHFQLGETGEGKFLIAQARAQLPDDVAYHQALELFVAEEGEHARLLQPLVRRFGGKTIRHHWTHTLFRLVRRALGFKFEIQLLVTAELVGTAYYRLLQARTRDPVLDEACTLILKDEAHHVDFHADWFGDFQSRLLPLEREIWNAQFQLLFTAAAIAWIDHRSCLQGAGANRAEFFREARRECILFLKQLNQNAASTNRGAIEMPAASCPT